MRWKCAVHVLVLIMICQKTSAQVSILDNFTKFVKQTATMFLGKSGTPMGFRAARQLNKVQDHIEYSQPFPCDTVGTRSSTRPESVHRLRPGDIDIVAAMGDSLTAANGGVASRLVDIVVENRGISWTIGGQGTWRQYLTLPNILKEFNPRLFGFSLGDSWGYERRAQFNVGEPVGMSRDMPHMAKVLVKRIRADKRVNFEKDWKLVTIMIGANDFCADICYRPEPERMPEVHRQDLTITLDYLRDHLPRTFVNVVEPPNVDLLRKFKNVELVCRMSQMVECPCIFGEARRNFQKRMSRIIQAWIKVVKEVTSDRRYHKKDDFTVVLQTFTSHLVFPERLTPNGDNETDFSLLSKDCFHFSQKGYARAANALWNNMLEPVKHKSTNWNDTFAYFACPTQDSPYFFTPLNSG